MDPDRIQAIVDWLTPTTVKHVLEFLGFSNFYRRFVKLFSLIAKALSDLTKKTTQKFTWTPEADKAFNKLKIAFTTVPVLI